MPKILKEGIEDILGKMSDKDKITSTGALLIINNSMCELTEAVQELNETIKDKQKPDCEIQSFGITKESLAKALKELTQQAESEE